MAKEVEMFREEKELDDEEQGKKDGEEQEENK